MKRLRVGVIGLGVGEQHVAAFRRSKDCEVVMICDISKQKREMARKKYPNVQLSSDADQVLTNDGIDVVSIASYDEAHFQQVKKALGHGKHVFVEKPLCRSAEEAAALKKIWLNQKGRLKLGSNLVLRSAPLYQWLKRKTAAGFFGEIYAIDADYLYGRLKKITHGWRKKTPNYSVMLGGGIHLIDLLLWITGQRPAAVSALGNRIASRETAFRYNDFVAASLRFPSSLVGRVTANFGCVHRHHHTMRIFGTKKTFIYDDAGARVHASSDPEKKSEPVRLAPLPRSKGELIPDFITSIVEDRDTMAETQILVDAIAIASACDRSIKSKKEELIKYL